MDIDEITVNIESSENLNEVQGYKEFPKHLSLIEKQYDCLLSFMVNQKDFKDEVDDGTTFVITQALLFDSLKKSKICKDLAMKGYYSDATTLIRRIYENSIHIIYLSENKGSWKNWVLYNNYNNDRARGLDPERPNSPFFNHKGLLEEMELDLYYNLFRFLSGRVHSSSEALYSNFDPVESGKKGQMFFYAPRYYSDQLEFCLNVIFGFINESIWKGINNLIRFVEVPSVLKEYHELQEDARVCFDKFYE